MIPPIYILVTVAFPDVKSRARYFGVVSGAGGLGAAAGPLIGGLITSAISWRASFGLQVLVVAWIIVLGPQDRRPGAGGAAAAVRPDRGGPVGRRAVLRGARPAAVPDLRLRRVPGRTSPSASTVVIPKGSISPVWLFVAIGALFLLWFFLHVRAARAEGQGRAAAAAAVPQQGLQPGPGHPDHPVADPAGVVLRHLGLPAGGRRLQRDQDRPDAHPGHDRDPGRLGRRRPARPAASAAVADHRRLPGHRRRHDPAAGAGQGALRRSGPGCRGCSCSAPGSGSC